MPFEQVTVDAGGFSYQQWIEATVEAGAQQAARAFSIIAAEPNSAISDAWPLRPGVEVGVKASGELLVKGYIDTYAPDIAADTHRAVISGRSKSKDPIDSSAVHKTGEWKQKTIKEIADDLLKPFGVDIKSDVQNLKKIPVWRLAPGATAFEEIEAIARQQGLLVIGVADGNLKLTRADKFQMHGGAIQEGVNIIQASAQLSEKGKHDRVYARGQKRMGSGADAQRLESVSRDKTVERHRPLIVLAEGETDSERLKERAKWQVARDNGWATMATIKVRGWRDANGELWDPEKLVYVESKRLKIDQPMAIRHVRFLQNDSEGTTATLALVDPQALGGKSGGGKSNAAWGVDIGDDQ